MENNKRYSGLDVINPNRNVRNPNRTVPDNIIPISTKQREIPQNKERRKKKINKANVIKRRRVLTGIALSLGVVSANLIDSATEYFEEQQIIGEALDEYAPIVKENAHVLKDENGKPIYNGKDAVFWIDTGNIGNWVEEKLEQGANEKAVVYGIYHNLPESTEKENNFRDILDTANLPVDWAIENGYTGMYDKELKENVHQEYLNEYYNSFETSRNIGGK